MYNIIVSDTYSSWAMSVISAWGTLSTMMAIVSITAHLVLS